MDAGWRAFRTFCQTALAAFGGTSLDLFHANMMGVLSVSAGSALLSLLMSVDRSTVAPVVEAAPVALAAPLETPVTVACGTNLR